MSWGRRVFIFLLSLFPLIAPYELLLVPKWKDFLNPVFLIAALIAAGAVVVSGFFLWAAVAGLNRLTRFSGAERTFTHIADAPIVPRRQYQGPARSIRALNVETHDWSDSSPSYSLSIELESGHTFSAVSSRSSSEIVQIKEQIEAFLTRTGS